MNLHILVVLRLARKSKHLYDLNEPVCHLCSRIGRANSSVEIQRNVHEENRQAVFMISFKPTSTHVVRTVHTNQYTRRHTFKWSERIRGEFCIHFVVLHVVWKQQLWFQLNDVFYLSICIFCM